MEPVTVYLALGSNLGDRRANLVEAIRRLGESVAVTQRSSIYETEPAYVADQPPFLNMALRGVTRLGPLELLRALKGIERAMGREASLRFGPRPIDLDILTYGDLVLDEPELTVPHPRIAERAFVLAPLAEIAPQLRLPGQAATIAELAAQAQGLGAVLRVEPAPSAPV
jgi:2-amino-4-hydroxy-6-hydroxymethyldihydropteridine diphosphokinase